MISPQQRFFHQLQQQQDGQWVRFSEACSGTNLYRINLQRVADISCHKHDDGEFSIKFFFDASNDPITVWFKDKPTRDGAMTEVDNILGVTDIKPSEKKEVEHMQSYMSQHAVEVEQPDFAESTIIEPSEDAITIN